VAFADKVADVVAVLTQQTKDRVHGQRVDALRRESELLATRLLENPPEDPELYILLAVEAVRGFTPSARALLALNHAIASSRLRGCFAGHSGPLTACRYLPDGERFVTASTDATARLWSARTGEVLATFGHDSPVLAVAVSADSHFLAAALADGSGRVWSLDSATETCRLIGHQRALNSVAFSPDGQYVVTASEDRTARVWNAHTGQHLHTLGRRNREPRCAVFSPADSSVVVTGAWGFRLLIWNARDGKIKRKLWGAFGPEVDVSPEGERIVTPYDNNVEVWDLRKRGQRCAVDLKGHSANVASVAFGSDGETIVSAAPDRTVRIWHLGDPDPQVVPIVQGVASARLSPDRSTLLTACDDGRVRLWELEPRDEEVVVMQGSVAAVSRDCSRFVTSTSLERFILWEISGRKVGELGAPGFLHIAAFSPDGTVVACTEADSKVSLWDAAQASVLASWPRDQADVRGVEFSSDGSLLLTAGGDGTVHIMSVADATQETIVDVGPRRVETVRCSPRGNLFATIHDAHPQELFSTGVGIFDIATGRPVRILDDHRDGVRAVVFSPDGSQLATACWDGRARIFDAATGALLWALNHGGRVECLCYSPALHDQAIRR
jgi:WD40 repeat protein